MPTTSDLLFVSATQSNKGTLFTNWIDVDNVEAEANYAYCPLDAGRDVSEEMYLRTPLAGAEIPSNAEITHIKLSAYVQMMNASSDADIQLGFRNGDFDVLSISSAGSVRSATDTVAGWGLSQQELEDFINGVAGNEAYTEVYNSNTFPATDIRVSWVKCQFTYELLPMANCPALF